MINTITELMLSEYFLISAVLGKFLDKGKELFNLLANMFFIDCSEAEKIYGTTENKEVRGISNVGDYMRRLRIMKYSELIGFDRGGEDSTEDIIRIKGNALLLAKDKHMIAEGEVSKNTVYDILSAATNNGQVSALRITGILQHVGIFFEKNESSAIKKIKKTASWKDIVSILALLNFYDGEKNYNLSRLRAITASTPYYGLYVSAKERLNIADNADVDETLLLGKAFLSGALKPEQYEPKYARVMYARAIGIRDKERAIFTDDKSLLSAVSNLPLKLRAYSGKPVISDISTVLDRRGEQKRIYAALNSCLFKKNGPCRPVCLSGDSTFMLELYADAIRCACEGSHVEEIDLSSLSGYDFEPSGNNIFVRSADEDKVNIYLIYLVGDVSDAAIRCVVGFLQEQKRSKFYLGNLNVTLDLGGILPVCLCDKENSKAVSMYCDTVSIADPTSVEKERLIDHMLGGKDIGQGKKIILAPGCAEMLGGYSLDRVAAALDSAVRSYLDGGEAVLTADKLSYYLDENAFKIGFGGGEIHERK